MISTFQTTFAVPLSCDSCIKDVTSSLYRLKGIKRVDANLKDQLILVEGTAAPSAIVAAIQATGRDAILRGSGTSNSAAVCILETHSSTVREKVRGLARIVQVSRNLSLIDLTIRGLSPGLYWVTVRQTGDISQGPASTGGIWKYSASEPEGSTTPQGVLGSLQLGRSGVGSVFLERPIQLWEIFGRSMVISKQRDGKLIKEDPDTLVGVIARSAGTWDNNKTVCSCSGQTVWDERKEQIDRGMM